MIVINRSETKCDYIKGNISDVDDNAYYVGISILHVGISCVQ